MRGKSTWHYKPYTRLNETHKQTAPYICGLAPNGNECRVQWFDQGSDAPHTLIYRLRADNKPAVRVK